MFSTGSRLCTDIVEHMYGLRADIIIICSFCMDVQCVLEGVGWDSIVFLSSIVSLLETFCCSHRGVWLLRYVLHHKKQ